MKKRESITISPEVNEKIKDQAQKENRNYSNMIETMAKSYFDHKGVIGDIKDVKSQLLDSKNYSEASLLVLVINSIIKKLEK